MQCLLIQVNRIRTIIIVESNSFVLENLNEDKL
jgi:hypothetical protein